MNPYKDIAPGLRKFSEEVEEIELKWHRDEEDRAVVSVEETDWKIQLEDQLPVSLNSPINIKAGTWHRVIKGTGGVTVKIIKNNGNK